MKNALLIAALLFTAALPWSAAASIMVVDVMYDVPGTDTKREWVEFYTDTTIPDIRTWRFLEGGVRHKITGESGAVPTNTRFILAADPVFFYADNPEYTGLVFDTAMSLSNSGESLSLIDEKGVSVVTHTYVAPPKPVAQKTAAVTEKAVAQKSEPRVLGAKTTELEERSKQVAAAIESTSPEWAWFSFGFLGLIVLAGFSALVFIQLKK